MTQIVTDHAKLWNTMRRLHKSDSSFMFSNAANTFKIAIRNEPEGGIGHFMNMEVLAKVEEGDDVLTDCLDNIVDAIGWNEDRNEFIFAGFELDRRTPDEADLKEMVDFVNQLYVADICPCGKHMVMDKAKMCFFCEFTSNAEKLVTFDCPICMEECHEMHSVVMPCCKNKMHKLCDDKWYKKGNKACAMCRTELPERTVRTRMTLENLVANIAREVEQRLANPEENDDDDEDSDYETEEDGEETENNTE